MRDDLNTLHRPINQRFWSNPFSLGRWDHLSGGQRGHGKPVKEIEYIGRRVFWLPETASTDWTKAS